MVKRRVYKHSHRYGQKVKQYGKSVKSADRQRPAKPVGWRVSEAYPYREYFEARRNRSDRSKRTRL